MMIQVVVIVISVRRLKVNEVQVLYFNNRALPDDTYPDKSAR
jgi:hypothetical protein